MQHKAVFWDLDGTLVDSEPLHDAALALAMRSVGIEPPAELHERAMGRSNHDVYRMMRDEFDLNLPYDDWAMRTYAHYLASVPDLRPRAGALEIFGDVRELGVEQSVVSNSDRLIVDANLRAVGMAYPGMKTVSRNDVLQGKPDPEPYIRAAWLCRVEPSACVVIEDSWAGALAGVAAGMTTLFWPEAPVNAPPRAVAVASASEIRLMLGLGI